ncbi:PucR family transcriptional regulator [Antrihabitans stalactiti]|nr:helix-turn-helix domain-containing protein [Antrihabitans stalactiti]
MDSSSTAARTSLRERAMAMVVGFSDALPAYEQVPAALVEGDFARGARANVDLFFDFIESGTLPDSDDLVEVIALAVARVREGVPLSAVLGMYRNGATVIWDELAKSASPDELAAMRDVGPGLMQYVASMTEQVAIACVEPAGDPLWEQRERKRAVAAALLSGAPINASTMAPIARSFLVSVFDVESVVDPAQAGALRNRLDRIDGAFLQLDTTGWTALTPMIADEATAVTALQKIVDELGVPRGELWVGAAAAPSHDDVPAAAADAHRVASLCRRTQRASRVMRPRDLLLEFVLTAGPDARRQISSVSDALTEQPALAQTLEVFFDCEFNQLATARRLDVHRNTVTYRFARIAALTGFDPLRPRDAMVLLAARLHAAPHQ